MAFTSIGYDGTVNELQWAELVPSAGSSTYGVKDAGDLKVTAVPGQPLMVSVAAGTGWGHGVMDTETANTTITCDSITSGSRWDLIALRRDWQPLAGGPTSVVKVTGTTEKIIPGSREDVPGVVDDQPLALVQWTAGQTQPTQIVDLRCWAGAGGVFAKDDLVRTYMDRIGTRINIKGAAWSRQLGANDIPEWVEGPSTRVVNASLTDLSSVTGLTAVTTNGNGDVSIPVPSFLTSITNVVLTDATATVGGPVLLKWTAVNTGTTVITCRAFGTNGAPLPNYDLTISWTAYGLA